MTQVEDWAGRTTNYTYDANNRLVSTQRPDGSVETRYYNDAGQLIQQIDQDANENILTQFDFTYNAAGNITTETNNLPEVQITDESHTLTYTSDNRLDTYDGASVQYDADGNMVSGPLNGQLTAYTFNSRNQLTAVGTSSYTYDAEGNRIAVNLNGIQYTDVINPNAALSQLLVRTGPETQIFYVYGLGLIGEQNGNDYKVYHYDLRGSTVLLTDLSGATTDSYQYGPYGELLNHTGSSNTQFLYNGRDGVMTDGNGLYYMRARYYSPEMQRFVSRDSLEGSITDPRSLNRYIYVKNDPIVLIDPSGHYQIPSYLPPGEYLQYQDENLTVTKLKLGWGRENLCIAYGDTGNGEDKNPTMQQIKNYIILKCVENEIPVDLGLATAMQESTLRQYKDGKVYEGGGGYGIMQIQKSYHGEAFAGGELGIDVTNNWHDNVDYGIKYLAECYYEAKNMKKGNKLVYTGNEVLKATYSNYNSGSCSAYKRSSEVRDHVSKFWNHYTSKSWEML